MNVTIGGQTYFLPRSATLAEIKRFVVTIQYLAAFGDPRRV